MLFREKHFLCLSIVSALISEVSITTVAKAFQNRNRNSLECPTRVFGFSFAEFECQLQLHLIIHLCCYSWGFNNKIRDPQINSPKVCELTEIKMQAPIGVETPSELNSKKTAFNAIEDGLRVNEGIEDAQYHSSSQVFCQIIWFIFHWHLRSHIRHWEQRR